MSRIKIHDSFFKESFGTPERISQFLKVKLPEQIRKHIELNPDKITIDPNNYIAEDMKEHLSDLVVKTSLKGDLKKVIEVDLYILIEHKSYAYRLIFIQLLGYMYLKLKSDAKENKSLSIILPFVFYHGKEKWNIPERFIEEFDVADELKEYMLDFQYILFDTSQWNLSDDENEELRKNIELYSSLLLLKGAYQKSVDIISKVFDFWAENGFDSLDNIDKILFYLMYISHTRDIKEQELWGLLNKSGIKGEEIMPTLAQKWIEQGIEKGIEQGIEKGIEKGNEEKEIKMVLTMMKKGLSIDQIHEYTDIDKKRIKEIIGRGKH